MANLAESAVYDAGVYQLEVTDQVSGGATGLANLPQKSLANRTAYLKAQVDGLVSGTTGINTINGGQISGFRNKIINGDMQVSQVNGGTAVTSVNAFSWPIDQWTLTSSPPSKITVQQVLDAPTGFKYSTKLTVAATVIPAAGDVFGFSQQIEGQNLIDLSLGSAAAATIAVSFWVKGSIAGNFGMRIGNFNSGMTTRNYLTIIPVTTVWTKQTVVLPGDVSGAWATDNTSGLQVAFDLGCGTTYQSAALNSWQVGNFLNTAASVKFVSQAVGSTLNITGVQLEQVSPGATQGTAFEHVSYADQLRWCQRYLPCFMVGNYSLVLQALDTVSAYGSPLTFPVKTRVPVTGLVAIGTPQATKADGISGGGTFSVFQAGDSVPTLRMTGCTGLVAGNASTIIGMSVVYFTGAQL